VSVYVDDMKAPYGRMVMCHMLADTTEELLAMADRIGVARRWLQKAGEPGEHFDIALSKRALAVSYGAKEITWRQAGEIVFARRRARREREELHRSLDEWGRVNAKIREAPRAPEERSSRSGETT
jgi:hypothetical protein